ncbi:MAG: SRPBCC family protein [Agriterribacter sp.]
MSNNNNVSLHRVLKAPPEKVYRAFTQANAIASWLPPYGFICTVHEMNVREGGTYKMSFQNFSTGNSHSFGGKYVELKPNAFLKYTDQFDDPNLPGEMTTSVWLQKVSAGTEIKIFQENIPSMIPVEMCYLGWQESLEKLMKLVEPEIPDA